MKSINCLLLAALLIGACNPTMESIKPPIRILTVDPGHFHAALVQKSMYPSVDSMVYVYSPGGPDLDMHDGRIKNYNNRADQPTHWNQINYIGPDFFEKMISEKKGNLVVLSGNNRIKADYIYQALQAGLNVFADKPMIIQYDDFDKLKASFELAKQNKVLLYDIMTERYEISTMLQRALSMDREIFGTLVDGTLEEPAITKESVHHFYKFVSGNVLVRPQWFMDIKQQGEGLVDVTTHLVDLVQWESFPDQIIDTTDIQIQSATRRPTLMSLEQFKTITKANDFPEYLKPFIQLDTMLNVYCNGEINYTIKGKHAKTSVIWNYKAPDGTGDTHYSIMRGTKCNLIIRQGVAEKFKPTLYIEPLVPQDTIAIKKATEMLLQARSLEWPGIQVLPYNNGWKLDIPAEVQEGHEAHFARVMEKYLDYLAKGALPVWEVPNMLTKYFTTTKALQSALRSDPH